MDDIIKNTTFPRRWSFRELDFFSGGTSVKIKSDERVKSVLGAIITLVIYVLLGFFIQYFLSEFLDTSSPKIQLNTLLLDEPTKFEAKDTGLGGIYVFFLISNPSKDAGITEPYYLSYDTINKYYVSESIHEDILYKIDGLITKKVQSKKSTVKLGRCSESNWFKSSLIQNVVDSNTLMKFVIEKFAICPLFDEGLDIFGDDQSLRSARYKFTLSPCSDPTVCANAFSSLTEVSGQAVTVGTFQPVVKSSEKEEPFGYEINLDNVVPIGLMLNSKVILSLKTSEVETDKGWFIKDVVTESKATINQLRIVYDPIVTVGDLVSDPLSETLNFGVKYVGNDPPLTIRIVSSRVKVQLSRAYIRIPELIGNIGGTIEVVVMVFLVFVHWMENLLQENRISHVVGEHLKLPKMMRPPRSVPRSLYNKCCKKRNKDLAFKAQSSEVVGEIVDKALSIEEMSYSRILLNFILENSFPDEIRQLVPTVYVMRKILEENKQDAASLTSPRIQTAGSPFKTPATGLNGFSGKVFAYQEAELGLLNLKQPGPSDYLPETNLDALYNSVPDEGVVPSKREENPQHGIPLVKTVHRGRNLHFIIGSEDQRSPESRIWNGTEPPRQEVYSASKGSEHFQNGINSGQLFGRSGHGISIPTKFEEPASPQSVGDPTRTGNSQKAENLTILEAYRYLERSSHIADSNQVWRLKMLDVIHRFARAVDVHPPEKLFAESERVGFFGRLRQTFGGRSASLT